MFPLFFQQSSSLDDDKVVLNLLTFTSKRKEILKDFFNIESSRKRKKSTKFETRFSLIVKMIFP